MSKIHALYGFSPRLSPFQGLSAKEIVALLRDWGVHAIFGGYEDAAFVDAAHAAGLQVFAEFGCFVGERWWEKYLESRPVTADGQLMPKQGWYAGVIPTLPAIRRELLANLGKLVVEKNVDGVWLDFIRWPTRWESPNPTLYQTSFDPQTLQFFQQDSGVRISRELENAKDIAAWILAERADAWRAWKCEQITSFVRQAAEVVKTARPPCLLGLFSVPWRRDDFDGAIIRIMGQDIAALAAYVDVFSPMVYHRLCGQPVSWIGAVTEHVHALSRKPVWPIIQTMSEPDELSATEFGAAIEVALGTPASSGVILFTLKAVLEENKLETMREGFASQRPDGKFGE